ncbi:MAG: tRNA (adenosine(37)-N6)-threonylcarbamoyltransferase complex dimerization subunit type 1 TsaB [Patescibacteria group bacterium]
MILHIDTTKNNQVVIAVKYNNKQIITKKLAMLRKQAEKLLLEIDKLFKNKKIKLKDIKKIEVKNKGGSFTSLRIGVIIANTLGYALNIPVVGFDGKTKVAKNKNNQKFSIVEPIYDQE